MAEIKIEKKKPVWPWVILVLLIIGGVLFWLLVDREKEAQNVITPISEETGQQEDTNYVDRNNPVITYVDFIESDTMQMGLDHKYTHKAFTLLAEAVIYTAENRSYDLQKDISELKEKGDRIKKDPMSLTHANTIQDGFNKVITVFENMQQEVDIAALDKLKEYSGDLNPDVPTLEQKTAVKGFFGESAQILQDINK